MMTGTFAPVRVMPQKEPVWPGAGAAFADALEHAVSAARLMAAAASAARRRMVITCGLPFRRSLTANLSQRPTAGARNSAFEMRCSPERMRGPGPGTPSTCLRPAAGEHRPAAGRGRHCIFMQHDAYFFREKEASWPHA